MKKSFLLSLTLLCATVTVVSAQTENPVPANWFIQNWAIILTTIVSLYEIFIRLMPTAASWSILTMIMKIINTVLPDKANDGKKHI